MVLYCGKVGMTTKDIRKSINSQNTTLSVIVTGVAIVIFGIFYTIVYRVTSNAYYSIVSGSKE